MNQLTRALAAGFAAVLLALPIAAGAVQMPAAHTVMLTSKIVQRERGGEYDGYLRLTVGSDGTILGTYQDDTGHFSTVSGGVDAGGKLWLQIGAWNRFHWVGTLTGNVLDASAYNGNDDMHLTATLPAASGQ